MAHPASSVNQERQQVADEQTFAKGDPEHLVLAQTKAFPDPLDVGLMPENEQVTRFLFFEFHAHHQRMAGVQIFVTSPSTSAIWVPISSADS